MSDNNLQTCKKAIKILRDCPHDDPYRARRLYYADQIESQVLIGNPEYDDVCVKLSLDIIAAAHA